MAATDPHAYVHDIFSTLRSKAEGQACDGHVSEIGLSRPASDAKLLCSSAAGWGLEFMANVAQTLLGVYRRLRVHVVQGLMWGLHFGVAIRVFLPNQ